MNQNNESQALAEWTEFLEEVRMERDWKNSVTALRSGQVLEAWEEVPYAGANFGGQN